VRRGLTYLIVSLIPPSPPLEFTPLPPSPPPHLMSLRGKAAQDRYEGRGRYILSWKTWSLPYTLERKGRVDSLPCYPNSTVEEGNFEHLFNFEANLKICQIFFHQFFLA
jgi:hypothetical protein